MTTPNILREVERQVLDLLAPLTTGPSPLLASLESADIFDDRSLEEAIQTTRNRTPAGFLSQPEVRLDAGNTNLPIHVVEFLLGALVRGRRTRGDRRSEEPGTYDVWQAAHMALHGKLLSLPGLMHPPQSAPVEVASATFPGDAQFSIVLMQVRVRLRGDLLATDYR